MSRLRVFAVATWSAIFLIFCYSPLAAKKKDFVLDLMAPESRYFGSYSGDVGITLGEVRDAGFAEFPGFLGMGPQAVYAVTLPSSRAEALRTIISQLLEATGLAAAPGDADYVLDVTVLRNRFFINQTTVKFRLRSEVFLEFTLREGSTVVGRVLACGNSQRKTQLASKTKVEATYQVGLNDALSKFLASETLQRLIGDGWTGPAERWGNPEITGIDRDKFYGPSDSIRTQISRVRSALEGADASRVVIQDFALKDETYKEKKDSDPELATSYLPELIRVHLQAFYPGAFETVVRRSDWQDSPGVVVAGDLLRFKIGSYMKRALIGFGAGKDKLEAEIFLKDGASGKDLFKLDVLSTNWGAGFQIKKGQIRDIADQAARDLAYLLVETLRPGYDYPDGLEVAFDGLAYPSEAGRRREGDVTTR